MKIVCFFLRINNICNFHIHNGIHYSFYNLHCLFILGVSRCRNSLFCSVCYLKNLILIWFNQIHYIFFSLRKTFLVSVNLPQAIIILSDFKAVSLMNLSVSAFHKSFVLFNFFTSAPILEIRFVSTKPPIPSR